MTSIARIRSAGFTAAMVSTGHSTSLPLESNNVSIDPTLKDAWGIPAIRVTYKDHPDDVAFARFLQNRSVEILEAAGAQKIWRDDVHENTGGAHLLETCRMGNYPATSVIDKYHRTHDVPNLSLCDGSSFVTSGRGQPTMTIQAFAFRAADHMSQFAKRNEI
jgi:choline dehydrogenase-like flavoprotein